MKTLAKQTALLHSLENFSNQIEQKNAQFNYLCDSKDPFDCDEEIERKISDLYHEILFLESEERAFANEAKLLEHIIQNEAKLNPRNKKWNRRRTNFLRRVNEKRQKLFLSVGFRLEREKADRRQKRFAKEDMLREVELFHEAKEQEEAELQRLREEYEKESQSQGMMDLIVYMSGEEELDELILRISEGELHLEDEAHELAKRYYLAEKRIDKAIEEGKKIALLDALAEAEDDFWNDYWEDYYTEEIL